MKRHRYTPRKRTPPRANYRVYPLGWRGGLLFWGHMQQCEIVVCPRCQERGLRVHGRWAKLLWNRYWMRSRVVHASTAAGWHVTACVLDLPEELGL